LVPLYAYVKEIVFQFVLQFDVGYKATFGTRKNEDGGAAKLYPLYSLFGIYISISVIYRI
jgi:hypothetical protein